MNLKFIINLITQLILQIINRNKKVKQNLLQNEARMFQLILKNIFYLLIDTPFMLNLISHVLPNLISQNKKDL